ncbi:Ssu72-like protein-domain-containing protein [Tribonema minus]|uniref:RNA polymerase II subunit A C-terminal domain phosphatase SSU72 n=1 Tax=Tribonema minus TaxID=303371 RepID=A0A836C7Y0_9STRA|nr:Ssu72-like protein-domain-containing protein [Tribonema minus]
MQASCGNSCEPFLSVCVSLTILCCLSYPVVHASVDCCTSSAPVRLTASARVRKPTSDEYAVYIPLEFNPVLCFLPCLQLHARAALLKLLSRDACTKRHPERWQDLGSADTAKFDIIICFNDKIFDLCIEDFQNRPPFDFKPIHIVSLPVMDTPQHAEQAMVDVLKLVKMLDACDDLDNHGADVVEAFQATTKWPILHQVCHL